MTLLALVCASLCRRRRSISDVSVAESPCGTGGRTGPADGGAPAVVAAGFTNVIDIAFAPEGSLYVLLIAEPISNFPWAR